LSFLKQYNIEYIDWFKVDSQGTDLRLLNSLSSDFFAKLHVIELEPWFIDAYKNEDRIEDCLEYMKNKKEFYLTKFHVKGTVKIPNLLLHELFPSDIIKKIASKVLTTVPGWAEITYMNSLRGCIKANSRDYILAWLFSILQGHNELAYVYSKRAIEVFEGDHLFIRMHRYSNKRIKKIMYGYTGLIRFCIWFFNKYFL